MARTKTFTEDEARIRKNQSSKDSLTKNYKPIRVNVKRENAYIWEQYAKSKGVSMYAMVHKLFAEAIEKDHFTPDIPYEDSIK